MRMAELADGDISDTLPDSGEVSPNRGAKRRAEVVDVDADAALDRMLAAHRPQSCPQDEAPAWALALNQNLSNQLQTLTVLEHSRTTDTARISALEAELKQLREKVMTEKSSPPTSSTGPNEVRGPHPDPWSSYQGARGAQIPPPTSFKAPSFPIPSSGPGPDGTDWNHLVLGGWDTDTKKALIENSVREFLAQYPIDGVLRVSVYGKRAKTAHLYLRHVALSEAKERFFNLLPRVNKKFALGNGALLWVSPSKPVETRMKNKLFGIGINKLLQATKLSLNSDQIEVDWGMAVVWMSAKRVLAMEARDLHLAESDRGVRVRVRHETFEDACWFNLSAVSELMGVSVSDLEVTVQSD